MGLDMYLNKRTMINRPALVTITGPSVADINPDRIVVIEERVASWQNAPAIHRWFVLECQDGIDDHRIVHVSRGKLEELCDLCQALLVRRMTDPNAASRLATMTLPMPKQTFLGPAMFDDAYWMNIAHTATTLRGTLAERGQGNFIYEASLNPFNGQNADIM